MKFQLFYLIDFQLLKKLLCISSIFFAFHRVAIYICTIKLFSPKLKFNRL